MSFKHKLRADSERIAGLEKKVAEHRGTQVPRGSYPTPFVVYLVLWLGSVILKSRRPVTQNEVYT